MVIKFLQSLHLENTVQNSSSARPMAGNKSRLRSLEKFEMCTSEGLKVGTLVKSIAAAPKRRGIT